MIRMDKHATRMDNLVISLTNQGTIRCTGWDYMVAFLLIHRVACFGMILMDTDKRSQIPLTEVYEAP